MELPMKKCSLKWAIVITCIIFQLCVLTELASADNCYLWKINLESKDLTQINHLSIDSPFQWLKSPDGKQYALGYRDTLAVYSENGQKIASYQKSNAYYVPLLWNAKGIYVLENSLNSANYEVITKIILFDQANAKKHTEWTLTYPIVYLTLSPDGKYMAYLYDEIIGESTDEATEESSDNRQVTRQLYLYDLATQSEKWISALSKDFTSVIWSPDSKFLSFKSADNHLCFYNLAEDAIAPEFADQLSPMAWSPNGKYLLTYNYYGCVVDVIDIEKWDITSELSLFYLESAKWASDSSKYYIYGQRSDSLWYLWVGDIESAKPVVVFDYYDSYSFDWDSAGENLLFSSSGTPPLLKPVLEKNE